MIPYILELAIGAYYFEQVIYAYDLGSAQVVGEHIAHVYGAQLLNVKFA